MENEQSSAQTEQTQNAEQPVQAQPPAANEGVQKRIDQLVAERAESERQKNELLAKVLELSARQSAPAPAPAPVPQVDPLAQFGDRLDPSVQEAIRAATGALKQQYDGILAQQAAQFSAQMNGMQVFQHAAQVGIDIPNDVKAKAAEIARQHGTSPEIALKLAYGEFAMDAQKKTASVRGYTPPATPVMTNAAPAPTQYRGPARPAGFDTLDPRDQAKWLETNGFEDDPI